MTYTKMDSATDNRVMRQIYAGTLAGFCLLANAVLVVAFPDSQRCSDVLLAGVLLAGALYAEARRWSALWLCLAGAMLLTAGVNGHGWVVGALLAAAVGLWSLRWPRQGIVLAAEPGKPHGVND